MCTMIVEKTEIKGSGRGPKGWFTLQQADVSTITHTICPLEHSLNIDFVNPADGLGARIAVELSPESGPVNSPRP